MSRDRKSALKTGAAAKIPGRAAGAENRPSRKNYAAGTEAFFRSAGARRAANIAAARAAYEYPAAAGTVSADALPATLCTRSAVAACAPIKIAICKKKKGWLFASPFS